MRLLAKEVPGIRTGKDLGKSNSIEQKTTGPPKHTQNPKIPAAASGIPGTGQTKPNPGQNPWTKHGGQN